MTGTKEMALGVATALSGVAHDHLPVMFQGLTLEGATSVIRSVITECYEANIPLHSVTVDHELMQWLTAADAPLLSCRILAGAQPGEALFPSITVALHPKL